MAKTPRRVLLVDDSEDDRFFTKRVMRKIEPELDVHEFPYAEDALSFLRSPERPAVDLVLIDINMPRMDGFEFADAYIGLYPELRGNAPVFIASSSLNPADQDRAAAHPGVAGFIVKPITRDTITRIFSVSDD